MTALATALIYFGSFLALGWIGKKVIDRWSKGASLSDIHDMAGPNRRERNVFLLGAWRKEK